MKWHCQCPPRDLARGSKPPFRQRVNKSLHANANANLNANATQMQTRTLMRTQTGSLQMPTLAVRSMKHDRESWAEEARQLGRTIGSGVNDGWLWTKTRAFLAA